MSTFYERSAATALSLITQYGQTVTLRDQEPGELDPITGTSTPPVLIEREGSGILQDYSAQEAGMANISGTLIQQGDKRLVLAAAGLEPPPGLGTTVIAAGATWHSVSVKEVNPAGTPLIYEVQLRR